MTAPDCSAYAGALDRVRELLGGERPVQDLRRYLTSYGGASFDHLTDRGACDEFTREDFLAVRRLSVSVLGTARTALRGEALPQVRQLLGAVPVDLDIWDVPPGDYDAVLGAHSPAWQLWQMLFDLQKGARSSGRGVTAGKLLHGKRPRLIPIFDRKKISVVLAIDQRHCWEAFWCIMRDSRIRTRLQDIQARVGQAAALSLLRVLDIVVWMSQEPDPPMTAIPRQ